MFRKRRPINDWPISQLIDHCVGCFCSDPDEYEVRSSIVLHQERALLPKNAEEVAAEAAEIGEQFDGLPEYVIFNFGFDEEERTELYMDHDRTCLVRSFDVAETLDASRAVATEWVGAKGIELAFRHLPGVYQASFVAYVTGSHPEHHPSEFMWAIPSDDPRNEFVPFREFPPRVGPTEVTPEPGNVSFGLLPRYAVDRMLDRAW
jgi:hypothetical protein